MILRFVGFLRCLTIKLGISFSKAPNFTTKSSEVWIFDLVNSKLRSLEAWKFGEKLAWVVSGSMESSIDLTNSLYIFQKYVYLHRNASKMRFAIRNKANKKFVISIFFYMQKYYKKYGVIFYDSLKKNSLYRGSLYRELTVLYFFLYFHVCYT